MAEADILHLFHTGCADSNPEAACQTLPAEALENML